MQGWQQPLGECKKVADLPAQARAYLDRMTELADTAIWAVSVGPEREQTVAF